MLPAVAVIAYLLKLQNNPAQDAQARQYQQQCLQALRELAQTWPQDKINALVTRLFYSALKHGTNALTVFTKSLLHELARETANTTRPAQRSADTTKSQSPPPARASAVASEQERLLARAQQQLAQFYWGAAGGKAGLIQSRESLQQLRKTSSALAAITAPSGSAIAKLKTSLPQWLQQAQRYLNSVGRSGQSTRLPEPPAGANSAVQQAVSAAAKALTAPGERETIKPRPASEVGELAALEQRRKYAEQLQKTIDAAGTQWHKLPLERQKNIIAKTAARFGIDPGHLERALQARRLNQLQAGATGGARASSSQTGSSSAQVAGTPTNADSDSPTKEPALEELRARITSLPFDTQHLQIVRDEPSGRLSLTVDPNKLDLEPRRAYTALLNKFGEERLTQILASLIMPSPGLAPASPNLDPETQLKLAKIIFNEPTQETINDLGQHRADDSIGHSLGALVLLQMGLLPSSREVFTAMREAFGSLGTIRRSPFEIVRRYAPTNAELVRAAGNQSTSGRPELSHLAFAALVASMLAKPEIHNKMKRPEDRPPFFEIQSRLLQLLESELNRSSSAEQDNPVLDDTRLSRAWSELSREQKLSVVADTQSRVFQLLESCGRHLPYLEDNQGNDMLKPEYILNAIGQYTGSDQLDPLITELRNRFKKFGENLPYNLVGEGAWNDNLISSLIRHAVAQALALKRTDADGQGQPQPQPFKRWLKMSEEERRRFLSDPTRAEQTRRWLALTAEQRGAILKKVIAQALAFSLN